jgi:hypothetical protein
MPARRCGVNKTRNVRPRASLQCSVWVLVLQHRSEGLVGCLQAGAGHQLEEEVR